MFGSYFNKRLLNTHHWAPYCGRRPSGWPRMIPDPCVVSFHVAPGQFVWRVDYGRSDGVLATSEIRRKTLPLPFCSLFLGTITWKEAGCCVNEHCMGSLHDKERRPSASHGSEPGSRCSSQTKLSDDSTLAKVSTAVLWQTLSQNHLVKPPRFLPDCVIHKYVSEPNFDVKK